jgi:hypothetical protein
MEPSAEEYVELAKLIGFELVERRDVESDYTGVVDGLFRFLYTCQLWVMRKPGGRGGGERVEQEGREVQGDVLIEV